MDWIQGDKFIGLANYTFSPKEKRDDDYDNLSNTLIVDKLRDGDIIYTHTFYAKQLFDVIGGIDKKLIVITHNSDANVDFPPSDNVVKWFSQNVNIIHPRVESIPIGLENNRWFKDIHKKEKMLAKLKEARTYKNLVYMNHNISTNPAKRFRVYELLKDKPWVTVDMGCNGSQFDEYLDNIYNHKFVICPEGNGIDTHRIWECLYMGTIPIIEDNINNSFYKCFLPTTLIKDWAEVNEVFLQNDYNIIPHVDWNIEMLTFEYWKNKIHGTLC
jgi:hypothetical protein